MNKCATCGTDTKNPRFCSRACIYSRPRIPDPEGRRKRTLEKHKLQDSYKAAQRRGTLKKYGLSLEDFNALLAQQNFACAVCRQPEYKIDGRYGTLKNLSVDHCHDSGKIRGLLCDDCNTTLGKIKDNISVLESMIIYLRTK